MIVEYKGYQISGSAVPLWADRSGGYQALGIVFDPTKTALTELKRLRTGDDLACLTREDAENLGLLMCKVWIDGGGALSTPRAEPRRPSCRRSLRRSLRFCVPEASQL
jgi:hypothetical protein